MGEPGGLREQVLVRLSEKQDLTEFMEVMINFRSASLDRTNDQEINEFNALVQRYKNLLFDEVAQLPQNEKGEVIDVADIIDKKKDLLSKPVKIKLANKQLSGEFDLTDIKSLIKGKS